MSICLEPHLAGRRRGIHPTRSDDRAVRVTLSLSSNDNLVWSWPPVVNTKSPHKAAQEAASNEPSLQANACRASSVSICLDVSRRQRSDHSQLCPPSQCKRATPAKGRVHWGRPHPQLGQCGSEPKLDQPGGSPSSFPISRMAWVVWGYSRPLPNRCGEAASQSGAYHDGNCG